MHVFIVCVLLLAIHTMLEASSLQMASQTGKAPDAKPAVTQQQG
jgi:hypothetical protein